MAGLIGFPLVGVIFAMSVLEYGGPAPFAWMAGALSLAAIVMSLPRLRRTHFVFLAIAVTLVGYLQVFIPALKDPLLMVATAIGAIWLCTLINLRGIVLPIIDLGARFGLTTSEPTARHVIMVAHIGGRMVGLLVDAVSDILQMSEASVQPTPDVASDQVKTFVKGIFSIDGRMISLIELDYILPQVEAEAA